MSPGVGGDPGGGEDDGPEEDGPEEVEDGLGLGGLAYLASPAGVSGASGVPFSLVIDGETTPQKVLCLIFKSVTSSCLSP